MHPRQLFLQHVAQTSESPLMLEIEHADGYYLFDSYGKKYIDLISGIAVANIGHNNTAVKKAIHDQVEKYLHIMVYGEFIESPQVQYAKWIAERALPNLNTVYFTNSGSEAVEGAIKLAKRYTGRSEVISFKNSYHGSTMGALSAGNNESRKNAFRPLIPDNTILDYNNSPQINTITEKTACVLMEAVQAEAGVIVPEEKYLLSVQKRCRETGALFMIDECQTGFGRTGNLFAYQTFNIQPDVLILGKAVGGGMPLGAFVADHSVMNSFTDNPMLGHITTFGGHPVCCAAGLAAAQQLESLALIQSVNQKAALFSKLLQHPNIVSVRNSGLFMAVQFPSMDFNFAVNKKLIENGVLTDWFLFAPDCMRIAPPLMIDEAGIRMAAAAIIHAIESV